MAKKKRKKTRRPTSRPAAGRSTVTATPADEEDVEAAERTEDRAKPQRRRDKAAAAAPVSNRQARKEAARRERERRIKAARRRARIRRVVRWGVVLGVGAAIAGFVWLRTTESRRIQDAAAAAAQTLGCTDVEDFGPKPGSQHLQPGQPPPEYETTPATYGVHAGGTYQGPAVISSPVDPALETNLVHNLEHAYVVIYYRPTGEGALPDEVRTALAEVAESEDKVIMAPYPGLDEGQSLALTAWAKLQQCPGIEGDEGDAVLSVTRGFIEQFRGGGDAPEPAAA
jgi:Protein of unknown function (DUF3105)